MPSGTGAEVPAGGLRQHVSWPHSPWARAALAPLVVAVLETSMLLLDPASLGVEPVRQGPAAAYLAVAWAVLLLRRRRPCLVLVGVLAHFVAGVLLLQVQPSSLAVLVALFAVAAYRRPRESVLAVPPSAACLGYYFVVDPAASEHVQTPADALPRLMGAVAVTVLCWAMGRASYASSARLADAERRRAAAAEQAVSAERARLARELHDIISHSVSVMLLQAAGARRVVDTDRDAAARALAAIEETGKQTMTELHRLLHVLRTDDAEASRSDRGASGVQQVELLVAEWRSAGLSVELEQLGRARAIDPSVDLSAYRVVQEALTNSAKHAGHGTRVRVRLDWGDTELVLTIVDDGPRPDRPPRGSHGGHGLVGMTERVAALGGRLVAEPVDTGGFAVVARLPLTAANGHAPATTRAAAGASP